MRLYVYTMFDSKAEAYQTPFYSHNHATAIRSVMSMSNNPEHPYGMYKKDFTLFCLGMFDDETGDLEVSEAKLNLGLLNDFYKTEIET